MIRHAEHQPFRLPPSRMERSRFWTGAVAMAVLVAGVYALLITPPLP